MKIFSRNNSCDGIYDSLDIRFTKACDNNCPFCIEKSGIGALNHASISDLVETTKRTGIKNILILGGEPMLDLERLLSYVERIRPFVDTIFLTTSLPKSIIDNEVMFDEIMMYLNGLNVSVQSTNSFENNKLFRASSCHDRMRLLDHINSGWRHKVRTSINLVKGGIDTKEKLVKALRDLEQCDCAHIKINELQHVPDLYVSFEKITGIKLPSAYACGCQTDIDHRLLGFEDSVFPRLTLKRSCFIVEQSCKASFRDFIKSCCNFLYTPKNKFGVMYEDGTVKNRWSYVNIKEEK